VGAMKENEWIAYLEVLTWAFVLLLWVGNASAEIRMIAATGEYRMGDNDTRTDAKRLALLDAKRLALEQAGTYIESITEVKNLALAKEEIRAYTAGIVEVVEQEARDTVEGSTHIVQVSVTAKIDMNLVARQIDALHKNESIKAELLRLRTEKDQLRQLLDIQTHQILGLKSKKEIVESASQRQKSIAKAEITEILTRAWIEVAGSKDATWTSGTTTKDAIGRATSLVRQAIAIDSSDAAAHELMGQLLFEEKRYQAAIEEFRTALAIMIKSGSTEYVAGIHVFIGMALEEIGKVDDAIAEYQAAISLEPNNPENYQSLGAALHSKNEWENAAIAYRKAIALDSNRADFHRLLGVTLLHIDLDAAIHEYKVSIRLKPDDAELHKLLGSALLAKGDRDGMIVEYYRAARLKPDEAAGTHWQLAYSLRYHGDLDGAIKEYRKSLELDPNKDSAAYELSLIFVDTGNWEQAYKQFRQIPSNRKLWEPMAYYSFGHFLQSRERKVPAARVYQQVLALTPETSNTKGMLEEARRRLAEMGR